MKFALSVEDQQINSALAGLQSKLGSLQPFLSAASLTLQTAVDEAFSKQADPVTGEPWDPLSPLTLKRRRLEGQVAILQDTGRLVASNVAVVGDDFASVSNNVVYAAVHQFGSKDGTIPARPFFGLSEETKTDLLQLMAAYLG